MLIAIILAQATAAVTPSAATPAKTGPDRIVCVAGAPIGSRLPGNKVCRTAAEWERDRRDAQGDVERAQRLSKLPGQ